MDDKKGRFQLPRFEVSVERVLIDKKSRFGRLFDPGVRAGFLNFWQKSTAKVELPRRDRYILNNKFGKMAKFWGRSTS
jgi:hypothetical protein